MDVRSTLVAQMCYVRLNLKVHQRTDQVCGWRCGCTNASLVCTSNCGETSGVCKRRTFLVFSFSSSSAFTSFLSSLFSYFYLLFLVLLLFNFLLPLEPVVVSSFISYPPGSWSDKKVLFSAYNHGFISKSIYKYSCMILHVEMCYCPLLTQFSQCDTCRSRKVRTFNVRSHLRLHMQLRPMCPSQ